MRTCRKSARCFTVIEMLVVVTIIGILAGLLVPVISKAKWHAWNAKCKSNLKNLQTAAMTMVFENDGRLPLAQSYEWWDTENQCYHPGRGWVHWNRVNSDEGGAGSKDSPQYNAQYSGQVFGSQAWTYWWGLACWTSITNGTIYNYTGHNINIYSCPIFLSSINNRDPNNNATKNRPGSYAVRSYVMNSQVSNARISDIQSSRRLLFADSVSTNAPSTSSRYMMNSGDHWAVDGELIGVPNGAVPYEGLGTYHNGKGNAVFVDGHVELLSWSQLTNACSGNW